MKSKLNTLFILSILSIPTLTGCEDSKINKVIFHFDNETEEVSTPNDGYYTSSIIEENIKFFGWSLEENGQVIIKDEQVQSTLLANYFKNNEVNLYAVYESPILVTLYDGDFLSFLHIYKSDTEPTKTNYQLKGYSEEDFLGWSADLMSDTINIKNWEYISYSDIEPYILEERIVVLFAKYNDGVDTISVKDYPRNQTMAKININTKDGIAIDDPSLINPNEHKGKNGELPVYNYVKANISVSDCIKYEKMDNIPAKVKVRGNYTSSYDKKPIRIKFDNPQKMLGLNNEASFKNWVLLANWKDTSCLRDAIAHYIGNSLLEKQGFYDTDFRFVKVYLNNAYNGTYLLVEQQEIAPERVNIPKSKEETDSEKTGYLLEYDGYYQNEPENQRFTVSYNDVKTGNNGFTISNDIMNTNQHDYIKKVTQNIWNVVYDALKREHKNLSTNPYHKIDNDGNYVADSEIKTAADAVSNVINIDSLVNLYALHEIIEDRDIGFSSFYFSIDLSEEGDKKLTFNAPWDFDYASGNSTFGNALTVTLKSRTTLINEGRMTKSGDKYTLTKDAELTKDDFKFANEDAFYCQNTDNPWFVVFNGQSWFKKLVGKRLYSLKKAGMFDKALEMIDDYTDLYGADFEENLELWPQSLGVKLSGNQPDIITYFSTQKQAAQYLKIWLEARFEGLTKAYNL